MRNLVLSLIVAGFAAQARSPAEAGWEHIFVVRFSFQLTKLSAHVQELG